MIIVIVDANEVFEIIHIHTYLFSVIIADTSFIAVIIVVLIVSLIIRISI